MSKYLISPDIIGQKYILESLNFNPRLATGTAFSQSEECGEAMALNLALSAFDSAEERRSSYFFWQ